MQTKKKTTRDTTKFHTVTSGVTAGMIITMKILELKAERLDLDIKRATTFIAELSASIERIEQRVNDL